MRMPELKSLARDRGLRNYSQMRKAELVPLLQNNPPPDQSRTSAAPTPHTRPPPPPPPTQTWEPIDDRDRGSLVHKKWIYLNSKKLAKVDHKSRPILINGTIG